VQIAWPSKLKIGAKSKKGQYWYVVHLFALKVSIFREFCVHRLLLHRRVVPFRDRS